MAKELHSDMAHARHSDGINVIFDQKSPARSRSRSPSSSSSSSCSSTGRSYYSTSSPGRGRQRGRCRSSSSSSSSSIRSSAHSRSRSHPRCHRGSSRCRCENHPRYCRGRYHRSPPRGYRASRHSHTCSPSQDRYSHRCRSRSRSSGYRSRRRSMWAVSKSSHRVSRSSRNHRSRSKCPSPARSVHLSVEDKRQLLEAAQANAVRNLGTDNLELPESVKPVRPTEPQSKWETPVTRVRHDSEKTRSQSEVEPDDAPSPKLSPKRKTIAFSINNSVAKPTVAAPGAKVTARADSYESRKPYGHWIQVKSV